MYTHIHTHRHAHAHTNTHTHQSHIRAIRTLRLKKRFLKRKVFKEDLKELSEVERQTEAGCWLQITLSPASFLKFSILPPMAPCDTVLPGRMCSDLSLIQHADGSILCHLIGGDISHYQRMLTLDCYLFWRFCTESTIFCSVSLLHFVRKTQCRILWHSGWLKWSGDWQPRTLYPTLMWTARQCPMVMRQMTRVHQDLDTGKPCRQKL